PGGIQLLDFLEYLLDLFQLHIGVLGEGQVVHDVRERAADVTTLVHRAHQELGNGPLSVIQIDSIELVEQVLVEGDTGGIGYAPFLVVGGIVVGLGAIVRNLVVTQVFINIDLLGIYGLGVRALIESVPIFIIHVLALLLPALKSRVLL